MNRDQKKQQRRRHRLEVQKAKKIRFREKKRLIPPVEIYRSQPTRGDELLVSDGRVLGEHTEVTSEPFVNYHPWWLYHYHGRKKELRDAEYDSNPDVFKWGL